MATSYLPLNFMPSPAVKTPSHCVMEAEQPETSNISLSRTSSQLTTTTELSTNTSVSDVETGHNAEARRKSGYGHYPLHDANQRPVHVVIVGAGPSGLSVAMELQELPNVTFQILEKNIDVGGTWFENRYPGAACDVASHAYQWSKHGNPDWTHHFAPAEEIGEYIKDVAAKVDLYRCITFESRVVGATWSPSSAKWHIKYETKNSKEILEMTGDLFVNAGGILNDWKWPDIPGLEDFNGPRLHTASWDASIDLSGKSVGVIGSGATAVQLVPTIQPVAASIEVFIRSPTYILSTVGFGIESSTYNQRYSEEQKDLFRKDQAAYLDFRKRLEQQMNENFAASLKDSQVQKTARNTAEQQMRDIIQSVQLQDKLIPKWELGCRRITPGLPYLQAVQQSNVAIERNGIARICADGIETCDGQVHKMDVLICATGFDTSFSGRYDIVGLDKQSLRQKWKQSGPEAYLGLTVAGYPNYFTLLGPNCPIANGSLFPCIEASAAYIRKAVEKMQRCHIRTLEVKQSMQDSLNAYMANVHRDLVWSGTCSSWYKDRKTGKVTAVWPGSSIHYMEVLQDPRWEDYDITYCDEDSPWSFLGDGRSQRETYGQDLTWYLDPPRADMNWN